MVFNKEWLENCKEVEKKPCVVCGSKNTRLVFNPNGVPFPFCEKHIPNWDCSDKPISKVFKSDFNKLR